MKKGLEVIVNRHLFRQQGFINGKFTGGLSKNTFKVFNPASGLAIAELPSMDVRDTEEAIKASKVAFSTFKNIPAKERAKMLLKMGELMIKYKDDLAAIITLEAGKPFKEAQGEIAYAASFYELYAEEAKRVEGQVLQPPNNGRRLLALKQPVGPAALITPVSKTFTVVLGESYML